MQSDETRSGGKQDADVFRIRPIDPSSPTEIEQVVVWMRQTLIEVLGAERGSAVYSMDWLTHRVLWHLDEVRAAQIFVAVDRAAKLIGHTIVRVEQAEDGSEMGLFSTTYVDPDHRRAGVALKLLEHGEQWMRDQGMTEAMTYTDKDNIKLHKLYRSRGYRMTHLPDHFVMLSKPLT